MAEAAIYMSTAGMNLCYGIETVSGQKPTVFKIIQGATSLSEISSEKEQIEVTPLSATDYKEYVGGLADPGGVWEVGFNESNVLHETWAEIVEAYKTSTAQGLRMWFQAYHPRLDEAFFVVGEPNILGFGGAEVAGVYTNTARITLNQIEGWSESIAPTEE
jgi:hypothetical protein